MLTRALVAGLDTFRVIAFMGKRSPAGWMIRHRIIGMISGRPRAQNVFLLFARILCREDEPAPTRGTRMSLSRSCPGSGRGTAGGPRGSSRLRDDGSSSRAPGLTPPGPSHRFDLMEAQ
jgi:hypothetical protein